MDPDPPALRPSDLVVLKLKRTALLLGLQELEHGDSNPSVGNDYSDVSDAEDDNANADAYDVGAFSDISDASDVVEVPVDTVPDPSVVEISDGSLDSFPETSSKSDAADCLDLNLSKDDLNFIDDLSDLSDCNESDGPELPSKDSPGRSARPVSEEDSSSFARSNLSAMQCSICSGPARAQFAWERYSVCDKCKAQTRLPSGQAVSSSAEAVRSDQLPASPPLTPPVTADAPLAAGVVEPPSVSSALPPPPPPPSIGNSDLGVLDEETFMPTTPPQEEAVTTADARLPPTLFRDCQFCAHHGIATPHSEKHKAECWFALNCSCQGCGLSKMVLSILSQGSKGKGRAASVTASPPAASATSVPVPVPPQAATASVPPPVPPQAATAALTTVKVASLAAPVATSTLPTVSTPYPIQLTVPPPAASVPLPVPPSVATASNSLESQRSQPSSCSPGWQRSHPSPRPSPHSMGWQRSHPSGSSMGSPRPHPSPNSARPQRPQSSPNGNKIPPIVNPDVPWRLRTVLLDCQDYSSKLRTYASIGHHRDDPRFALYSDVYDPPYEVELWDYSGSSNNQAGDISPIAPVATIHPRDPRLRRSQEDASPAAFSAASLAVPPVAPPAVPSASTAPVARPRGFYSERIEPKPQDSRSSQNIQASNSYQHCQNLTQAPIHTACNSQTSVKNASGMQSAHKAGYAPHGSQGEPPLGNAAKTLPPLPPTPAPPPPPPPPSATPPSPMEVGETGDLIRQVSMELDDEDTDMVEEAGLSSAGPGHLPTPLPSCSKVSTPGPGLLPTSLPSCSILSTPGPGLLPTPQPSCSILPTPGPGLLPTPQPSCSILPTPGPGLLTTPHPSYSRVSTPWLNVSPTPSPRSGLLPTPHPSYFRPFYELSPSQVNATPSECSTDTRDAGSSRGSLLESSDGLDTPPEDSRKMNPSPEEILSSVMKWRQSQAPPSPGHSAETHTLSSPSATRLSYVSRWDVGPLEQPRSEKSPGRDQENGSVEISISTC